MTIEQWAKKYLDEAAKYVTDSAVPDEKLLRGMEECIDIPEQEADYFRRQCLTLVGVAANQNQPLNYMVHVPRLYEAAVKYYGNQP